MRDPGLSEYAASVLAAKQVPPSLLKFELTEAALIGNVGAARETLDSLHSMGVQLMLDDFGTGYSSLSNLQLFPVRLRENRSAVREPHGFRSGEHEHDRRHGSDSRQSEAHGDC